MGRRAPLVDLSAILAAAPAGPEDDPATGAILDATRDLLGQYGMRRWTMDDVAEKCGLARATVYRRFESRNELVRAVIARETRLFFGSVTAAVEKVEDIEGKVVQGFLVGLRLARSSLLAGLLQTDPETAHDLIGSGALVAAGRAALVERYETLRGSRLSRLQRQRAEAVAEVLIRLGLTFVLIPDTAIDLEDGALGQLIRPILGQL